MCICMYVQPQIRKSWDSMENAIKKKVVISKFYFDLYFIADNMNTKYFMFCLVNFMSL